MAPTPNQTGEFNPLSTTIIVPSTDDKESIVITAVLSVTLGIVVIIPVSVCLWHYWKSWRRRVKNKETPPTESIPLEPRPPAGEDPATSNEPTAGKSLTEQDIPSSYRPGPVTGARDLTSSDKRSRSGRPEQGSDSHQGVERSVNVSRTVSSDQGEPEEQASLRRVCSESLVCEAKPLGTIEEATVAHNNNNNNSDDDSFHRVLSLTRISGKDVKRVRFHAGAVSDDEDALNMPTIQRKKTFREDKGKQLIRQGERSFGQGLERSYMVAAMS